MRTPPACCREVRLEREPASLHFGGARDVLRADLSARFGHDDSEGVRQIRVANFALEELPFLLEEVKHAGLSAGDPPACRAYFVASFFGISTFETVIVSPFISPVRFTSCPACSLSAGRLWLAIL